MDPEERQLAEYRRRLDAARANLESLAREADALERVVSGLEALASSRRRKRAPRGLPGVLEEIMGDGVKRSFEEIERCVAEHPKFREHPPASSSVSNRLGELVGTGYLTRPTKTTYELAPQIPTPASGLTEA